MMLIHGGQAASRGFHRSLFIFRQRPPHHSVCSPLGLAPRRAGRASSLILFLPFPSPRRRRTTKTTLRFLCSSRADSHEATSGLRFSQRVADGSDKVRLDAWLASHMESVSRARIQHSIRAGLVLVNGNPVKKVLSTSLSRFLVFPAHSCVEGLKESDCVCHVSWNVSNLMRRNTLMGMYPILLKTSIILVSYIWFCTITTANVYVCDDRNEGLRSSGVRIFRDSTSSLWTPKSSASSTFKCRVADKDTSKRQFHFWARPYAEFFFFNRSHKSSERVIGWIVLLQS